MGPCSGSGYGAFGIGSKQYGAHRVAYALANGFDPEAPAPPGEIVMHSCDVPRCCNPAHLSAGTHSENGYDRDRKLRRRRLYGDENPARKCPERVRRGSQHHSRLCPETVARGEQCGAAKLTATSVRDIRTLFSTGAYTRNELAEAYGCTSSNVGYILAVKTWRTA